MKLLIPLCALMFLTVAVSAKQPIPSGEEQTRASGVKTHSIIVRKTKSSKSHKVALYPDAEEKVLFFNVRGFSGRVYQLFVFDMQGNIIRQAEIRNKQTTFIKNMEKGTYLFEVFSNDDRIGEGQIAVL